MSLGLGDGVTCVDCGATATAASTQPSSWKSGDGVMLTWTNGPHPRHQVVHLPPERCMWCSERAQGWPSMMGRPLLREIPWTVHGPLLSYEIPPIPSSLERFAPLAREFEEQTGLRPPGRETAEDEELWAKWLGWLKERNARTSTDGAGVTTAEASPPAAGDHPARPGRPAPKSTKPEASGAKKPTTPQLGLFT